VPEHFSAAVQGYFGSSNESSRASAGSNSLHRQLLFNRFCDIEPGRVETAILGVSEEKQLESVRQQPWDRKL